MSLGNFFSNVIKDIESFFGSHANAIQTGISDAQAAVGIASGVAAAAGEAGIVPILTGVSDGLSKVNQAVQAEATATTLSAQVGALTDLASGLIQSTNDIGVKDTATKAAIGGVLTKVGAVTGVVSAAAESLAGSPVAAS